MAFGSSSTILQFKRAVVRRYDTAARQLRKRLGGASPTAEDLIVRELSDRTPTSIVEDFLQSDWKSNKRRKAVRRMNRPR